MIEDLISKYVNESQRARMKMQSKLFTIFTETTGWRPEDICLVEQQVVKDRGEGFTTIYYFDLKHRYQVASVPE